MLSILLVTMDSRLTKQLIKARQGLKKKYKLLKGDIAKSQTRLEKTYAPITKPLKELVSTLSPTSSSVKEENKSPKIEKSLLYSTKPSYSKYHRLAYNISSIPQPNFNSTQLNKSINQTQFLKNEETFAGDSTNSTIDNSDNDNYIEDSIREFYNLVDQPIYEDYINQFKAPLPRTYVDGSIRDVNDEYDHELGIFHNVEKENFFIGNSELQCDGPNIVVKGIKYIGTPGLYELLLKKNPLGFNKNDIDNYIDIAKRTNLFHRNYNSELPIKRFPDSIKGKYNNIVKSRMAEKESETTNRFRSRLPSLSESLIRGVTTRHMAKQGQGVMMEYTNKPIDYKYFDNYDELIDRLRLLVASQGAGNTGVKNEIVSILEELREGDIIE